MNEEKKMSKLNRLLDFVECNNKFYSKFYSDIKFPVENIDDLPILERRFIRENSTDIISKEYSKELLKYDQTNGTTEGKPLEIYKTQSEWISLDLDLWNIRRNIDKEASQKYVFYYYNGNDYSRAYKLYTQGNRTTLQLPMKKKNEEEFVNDLKLIKEHQIQWIIAPPSIIFSLCCISIKYDVKVNVRVIESISEYLPYYYKIFFEQVLGGKTYIHYSCHEIWGMAFTNHLGTLEIMDECILSEKKDERFNRGYDRCIATNLRVKSMPFINYELSDLVKISNNCIKTYGFRWTEEVKTKYGNIHCSFFDNIFLDFKDIELVPLENYQIVYTEEKISIYVATKNTDICAKIQHYISMKIKKDFQYNVTVVCINTSRFWVDSISGKMRGIINHKDVNWDGWEFSLINDAAKNFIQKLL